MARGRRSTRSAKAALIEEAASPALDAAAPDAVKATPPPKPRSSNRRTRSSRTFIPNSSDTEEAALKGGTQSKPSTRSRRLLKSVSIPTMDQKKTPVTRSKLPIASGFLIDQESSVGSLSLDNSDYETPGTSISATPATSIHRSTRSTRKSALSNDMNMSCPATSSRKRTHTVIAGSGEDDEDEVDMSPDAQLARELQKAEYEKFDNKRFKPTFEDSTDYNFLEVAMPAYAGKGKGKAKAIEPPAKSSRSSRSATKYLLDSTDEEDLTVAGTDEEDEFKLEDESVVLDDEVDIDYLNLTLPSDSENEEPLIMAVKGSKKYSRPVAKPGKKKPKNLSAAEKKERSRRLRRWQHIEDRWERKKAMNRERAEENHPKLLTMWDDLAAVPVLEVQGAEQPQSITRRLKPFQLEGLSWMMRQEKTEYKGGLLGDEMGMGKTIQAVSLIMSDYPAKEPTLVVVPPVALMQWSNEIGEYTDGKLKVLVYHSTNAKCKTMTVNDLKKFDVIMVSYNSLESLHRKETKGWTRGENIIKEASALHAIKYHRLILDEAHSIKSRVTGVAKACFALKGTYKWCLSGTPVQNRIGEFFSLLRFLEVRPFADYFCRSCKCEQLHWTVDEDHMCTVCHHGASEHISVFNQELLNPIIGDDPDAREAALAKLHMITARIMLRRMKRDHTNAMELPMKDIVIHNEFFSAIERDFSSSIMTNTGRKFDTYVAQGVMLNNYANIFGLIMQMRQIANHPDLLLKKSAGEGSQNVYVCNICDEPAEDAVRSQCRHEFCRACVKDFMETCEASGTDADCPRCHIGLSIDFEQPELEQDEDQVKKTSIINRIKMENWTSSTKIEMLVYDLYKLRSKKQTLKSIVFSQFTSMLQLIEWRLRRAGFSTVMLDGTMTPAQRQKSIEHFMTNPDCEVFLVSLKAGGVALNLTEASRVFIVDPWWNPAAEWQSADRCHRIGQRRPCVITRLCIEDSVESRIVALQEKKANMIAGTVNNDKVAMEKLTPEDLQFLFRGT
ncbi:hypothetical protein CC78DRAFT_56869 [Lojkania enalia]|uniref:DNA repair protein RAD16 n=1 Tax=Lojkania enalia TaxID=147567 RepID=A0A9P4JZ35_9PLEO|nr:hypothetical protein CC78DRAFT_56869 [Didymosphaeria enalia]